MLPQERGVNMLVLSRKKGETIIIGDGIEITVVDVQGDNVRIGVQAPREVKVYRQEVYEEIRNENRQAGNPQEPGRIEGLRSLIEVYKKE